MIQKKFSMLSLGSLLLVVTRENSKRSFLRFCMWKAPSTVKWMYLPALSSFCPDISVVKAANKLLSTSMVLSCLAMKCK